MKVGDTVTYKFRENEELFNQKGEVIAVYPSGAGGIEDAEGVLHIRLKSQRVLMGKASEWLRMNPYKPGGQD